MRSHVRYGRAKPFDKATPFDLLQAEKNADIQLTESFAMTPAASVSGLYFAHPEARYFTQAFCGNCGSCSRKRSTALPWIRT